MTVADIKRVDQLPIFARFVVDQLYPKTRTRSDESSYFSYVNKDPQSDTKGE